MRTTLKELLPRAIENSTKNNLQRYNTSDITSIESDMARYMGKQGPKMPGKAYGPGKKMAKYKKECRLCQHHDLIRKTANTRRDL